METLKIVGWFILGAFLFIILLGSILHILERRVVPNRYEWLEVLSHTEWKRSLQLRREMEKIKGTTLGGMTVYIDLDLLEEEGLVECREATTTLERIKISFYEYRLTPKGTRKRLETGSTQKNKTDLQLQPT